MSLPANPKADLQKAIKDGLAIVVAGTGVSIAASRHPQASWTGLLDSGLALLRKHDLIPVDEAAAHRTLLHGSPDTVQFIATAHAITREMSANMFRAWLKDTVGAIRSSDRSLLDALEEIRLRGNLLATTNYDGLLLEGRPHLTAVTWKDDAAFLDTHRHKHTDRVLFLHGHWDAPKSVVLDEESYQAITRNEHYRQDLTAVWRTSTWIYVGCGENGLSDPDIGLLLELYGQRAREDGHWDFCLVRDAEKDHLQRYFNDRRYNICAVPFGAKHADLAAYLLALLPAATTPAVTPPAPVPPPVPDITIPRPPAFYAEPDYIGSNKFVGRARELEDLSDWAKPADPTNLLLFEAIGGNGKSMLTWEWTKQHAPAARPADAPWAGRFWYSFYERGAIMADFCQRALAYMTARPLEDFAKKKTAELKDDILAQLHARPWLLILDGLERVLVAYHRIDAAEVPDEEANAPTDKIVNRNPCDAIRDEDNDLLRALAAAAPSKILVSSRLTPRVLLNPAGQPITGAKRITLPGLRPPDAEKLLRSCGVREDSAGGIIGDSAAIQSYLTANCDNHPLVIGILGGLIANYLPDRGNFDAWVADPQAGAALDLASLDLIQRRNHILRAALDALPPASQALLSTLALLTDSVDYETLKAFNPHLPPEPEEVEKPEPPEKKWDWKYQSDEQKAERQKQYEAALARWQGYEKAVQARLASAEFHAAPKKLEATVKDLEQRGLLQWDGRERKYDLHPVVRGVASGGMSAADRERHGQRVVDHFTAQPHRPYEEAETLEDVRSGLLVVHTLLKIGRTGEACRSYIGLLCSPLLFNLQAYADVLAVNRLFFINGWGILPEGLLEIDVLHLANDSAIALAEVGQSNAALDVYNAAIPRALRGRNWGYLRILLRGVTIQMASIRRFAKEERIWPLARDLAKITDDELGVFLTGLVIFAGLTRLGRYSEAQITWNATDAMGRYWRSAAYHPGDAETCLARFHFYQRTLQEEHLAKAERLATESKSRGLIASLHSLRGAWRLEQGEWALAAASYQEAVRLARERSLPDAASETGLALAKHHLRQPADPQHPCELAESRHEAERLAALRNPAHRRLAQFWLAFGDAEQAKHHALAAYRWAWADGEPYVHRYELTKTTELLQQMNVPIPTLPPYDPDKDEPLPWEGEVRAAIEKLRAEKSAKDAGAK